MGLLLSFFHFLRFWILQNMSDVLNSWTLIHKISYAIFLNVFLCSISYWNCYHKHDKYNLFKWLFCKCISDSSFFLKYFLHSWHCIASISHENHLLSCKCHMCGNSLEIKLYIRKHLQNKHLIFLGSKFKISTFQTSLRKFKTSRNDKWKQ